ncbi:tyrosine-type recombinase/integrase [Actinomadura rudentiformis]|uniref:Site-specific integrase n=1 Tax=Actinomadura rudentiformis TaxID=359158 RepID=A0A6H9YIR4_9ACTN|nr:site-specific integrase [Actinomadura rudentiformis]KAB2340619.1 site-specific integrase [Actinomadura rudentiformis]
MSARNSHLIVRHGKNGKYREVPLHPKLRTVLEEWLRERSGWKSADTTPRCSSTAPAAACRPARPIPHCAPSPTPQACPLGRDGIFTPHVLRHTAGTTMTRRGTDIVIVAELLGHSVETARRYSQPTLQDRQKAIERLTTDQ